MSESQDPERRSSGSYHLHPLSITSNDQTRPLSYALSDRPSPSSTAALIVSSQSSSPESFRNSNTSPTASASSGSSRASQPMLIQHPSESNLSQPLVPPSTSIRSAPSEATLELPSAAQPSAATPPSGSAPAKPHIPRRTTHNGKLGTLRTMSMRGKKPTRILKKRVVSKSDPKSYFSAERTLYSWVYAATVVLSVSLTLYSYISVDANLSAAGLQIGTVLSALSLVIVFYATFHFFWRRRALQRVAEATAFDDRLGPIILTSLIITALLINMVLAWMNPVGNDSVKVKGGKSFVPGNSGATSGSASSGA